MKRRLLILAVVFAVTNLWAGDPWAKSYKSWDMQDVRKILNDSPWSKAAEVERKETTHSLEAPAGAPTVAGARQEDEEDEQEEKDEDHGRNEKAKKKDDVKFLVRWISARTLREASVRGQVLQGRIAEAEEDKSLPPPTDDYELALVGTDMSAFRGADESTLRNKAYLSASKSKQKVTASQVEIVRAADGNRINAILFHFPKSSGSGQAIASQEERELRFVIRTEIIEIKANFDPQKMIDAQGMDL